MKLRHVFSLTLILFVAWIILIDRPASPPPPPPPASSPGARVAEDPEQRAVAWPAPKFEKNGYRLTALARFRVRARVLGVERYRFDREAELSPVDLALGWGPMSDAAVLSKISIRQSGRFYYWHVVEFPIPRHEIVRHSANMHLIPANRAVEQALGRVREGSVVDFSGYLVEARAADGFVWRSSLSRSDTGGGACELVWVEAFE